MSPRSARKAGAAPVFAALGDETRLSLVSRLSAEGPLPAPRLYEGARITRQAMAKHLQLLRAAGLVESTRTRPQIWRLRRAGVDEARASLERISREWDAALERLRAFVEE